MKTVLIIGQANVGKTLFTLRFAEFLGLERTTITFTSPHGGSHSREFTLTQAEEFLVNEIPHHTRSLQSLQVAIPSGKGRKICNLMDTSGLTDGIHQDEHIRKAMAQTLSQIRQANLILHMVDGSAMDEQGVIASLGEVDYQIAQFGQLKAGYGIIANKMDLPEARKGVEKLKQEFPALPILPVSALRRQGFKEVREFVKRHL